MVVDMFRFLVFILLIVNILAKDVKIVSLDIGDLRGEKYWQGDFYEFYGVPYATAPTGRDKFKVCTYFCCYVIYRLAIL